MLQFESFRRHIELISSAVQNISLGFDFKMNSDSLSLSGGDLLPGEGGEHVPFVSTYQTFSDRDSNEDSEDDTSNTQSFFVPSDISMKPHKRGTFFAFQLLVKVKQMQDLIYLRQKSKF